MAAAATKNIQLALALPARLRTFLARYPPASILPAGAAAEAHKTAYQEETPNPFMPLKHPVTGRWHDPKYSLRRQAELVKMAREHGVEELLPFTPKGTETRLRKRVELGLRVKGTGVGQKVKGHKHERHLGVKYVWNSDWRVWPGGGGVMGVHTDLGVQQDGEEETGHVGYAGAHQRMEEGMSALLDCDSGYTGANSAARLGNGTGPSSRNKRLEAVYESRDVFRLYQYQCTTFNHWPLGIPGVTDTVCHRSAGSGFPCSRLTYWLLLGGQFLPSGQQHHSPTHAVLIASTVRPLTPSSIDTMSRQYCLKLKAPSSS
jgi:large subunit ribosomal protein L25